jgi:23S rRNA pseudouridine1911/1915/1917 synthase
MTTLSVPKAAHYSLSGPPAIPDEVTLPPELAGQRLDQALSQLLPMYSRSRIAQWLRAGRITVDGHAALPKHKVSGGEKVRIDAEPEPAALAAAAEDIPLAVIYEDGALLVIDKPAGLVVHPGSGNWSGTMLNALLKRVPELAAIPRAGIVHRLDKDTSGLLVVAKTLTAQTSLVRQLQARTVKREYLALVHGSVARDGKVEAPIGRHPVQRTRMAVLARGKAAVTHYQVLTRFGDATLLRCRLETGRTHQIRVHMQSIGHPLVGDPVYGRRRGPVEDPLTRFPRQALHAERLALAHPDNGQPMAWQSAVPADMKLLMEQIERADTKR